MRIKSKRVVVTGGAGFIGSYLVKSLVKKGAKVTVIDLKAKPKDFTKKVNYIRGDARSLALMQKTLKVCNICYPLAAVYGGAKFIHQNQAKILSYNLELFSSVFNAAAKNKVGRIVFPSSAIVYHESLTTPAREEDLYSFPPTRNPYGFMKLVGEYFCHYFWSEEKVPYTIVRMFNVYGAGDTHEHVIPNFVKQALSGKYPFEIMGDGTETRVFTHVSDIVDGLIKISEASEAKNSEYNLSSEEEITMLELAKVVWKVSRRKEPFDANFVPIPSTTIRRRAVSAEKAIKNLGWKPKVPLERGIKEVVEWIKTSKK